ncbi:MAG TPA: response regulator [Steroidobacteraceae bacterium]|nr:response regulator [Steroidobacteraceae bacterium]
MIRSLIVEDAPIVRKGIRLLLQDEPDIEIIGEAGDGPEAVEQITTLQPDLVFLDIQMPGFDGFEVLERTSRHHLCAVVFITAYADYAMRAFDVNALSYLLKPINPARFKSVLQRARTLLSDGKELESSHQRLGQILPRPQAAEAASVSLESPAARLVVKDGDRFLLLKVDEIDWITSIGEYANVHARKTSYLIRTALSELARRLDIRQFVRIHRSTIINLDRVSEIQPRSHGDCDVVMHDGTVLRLSRSYRENLLAQ